VFAAPVGDCPCVAFVNIGALRRKDQPAARAVAALAKIFPENEAATAADQYSAMQYGGLIAKRAIDVQQA